MSDEANRLDGYIHENEALWDEYTAINAASAYYDVAGFRAGRLALDAIERAGVGDVAGRSLLHLQCHFGMTTLSFARLGARATGLDFSGQAIALARRLSDEIRVPARFIQSNVYDAPADLDGQFDIVFTSYGALCWLPDMPRWGAVVGRMLRPGGRFFIVEAHPTLMMMAEESVTEPRVGYDYFHRAEPMRIPGDHRGNYADPTARIAHAEYSWNHSLADVMNALIAAGLVIDEMAEYDQAPWAALPCLEAGGDGFWRMPAGRPRIPLTFAIRATRRPG